MAWPSLAKADGARPFAILSRPNPRPALLLAHRPSALFGVKVPLGEGLPTEPSSVGCHVVGVKARYLVGKLLTRIESLSQLW
jgi:hypothetical protein